MLYLRLALAVFATTALANPLDLLSKRQGGLPSSCDEVECEENQHCMVADEVASCWDIIGSASQSGSEPCGTGSGEEEPELEDIEEVPVVEEDTEEEPVSGRGDSDCQIQDGKSECMEHEDDGRDGQDGEDEDGTGSERGSACKKLRCARCQVVDGEEKCLS